MKPINEIRIRLCGLICWVLLPLFIDYYPSGSGWAGLRNMILVCMVGLVLSCFMTNFLIAFKKWWKE